MAFTNKLKNNATIDQENNTELSVSFRAFPFTRDQLSSNQLTDDLYSQRVKCSVTSVQSGMATISYQLITVGDTDIPGSPFTVSVVYQ